MFSRVLLVCLCLRLVNSLPPDKVPVHIIKARSIDLNDAHKLSMETRLDKVVEPTGYRLDLEPYLEDGLFKGHVAINVTWLKNDNEFNLHCSHEIEILKQEVWVQFPDDNKEPQRVNISKWTMDHKKPIATLQLEKYVPDGSTGVLRFSFKANLKTSTGVAFFKSTYLSDIDVESTLAVTAMRPNYARHVFPCFDEPGYKTPFELSVIRPRNLVALSNMPVARTENITDEPNAVRDHFERSPPMSTFTLGLVIADLKQYGNSTHVKDTMGNDIEIRYWGRINYHDDLPEVVEKMVRIFKELAEFWRVPLPLKKLDLVALPYYHGGFRTADNWGLIVFKEHDFICRYYTQVAQEMLYQWVGLYTTPAWWSDAHLNKALVGYIAATTAYKLTNGTEKDGKWPLTALYSLYYEFSKRYPHSRITGMKQETASTKIELLFRMFNFTLGEETFKKGLRTFLESRKFKTFSGYDIWNGLNTAAQEDGKIPKDVDIKNVAKSWIEKDRLPLISVSRQYGSNSAIVTQKLYLRERPHDVPEAGKLTWWVPIVVVTEDTLDLNNTNPAAWMKDEKEIKISGLPGKDQFIVVNPEEIAPFPVNYDQENWILISNFLQSNKRSMMPELTRAKLLHDAWNLAYAGELSFVTALNMTLFLKNEKHHLVWDPVFTMIDHIGKHICQGVQGKFQAYVRILLSPLYEELGKDEKEDDEAWRKSLRSLTKTFLCRAGYKPCVKEAQEQFGKWMQAKNPDEGNPLSNQYICPVFKWGTMKEWEFGLQRIINLPPSRMPSERTYLLKTLAGCPDSEVKINRLLNITMLEGNGNFSETDMFLILSMLTGSSPGYTTLFNFLSTNWDVLKERYSSRTNLWDSLITSATSGFTTAEGLELVSNLYVTHKGEFGSAEHIIEKSLRNIREEATWSAENLPVIEAWLDKYLASFSVKDDKFIGI